MLNRFVLALFLTCFPVFAQQSTFFTPGNLVVAVEGCGVHGGTCTAPHGTGTAGTGNSNSVAGGYGDNQAGPMTLFQYAPNGVASVAYVNSLVLPQAASGANYAVSGEYGSSSEGGLGLSVAGQYLALMGYGINAVTFDAAYPPGFTADAYGAAPSGALAQSGSLTTGSYTPVPRIVTLIDANGHVNSSTAVYNVFNTNNPRSAVTADGVHIYISGQGNTDGNPDPDLTGGVFMVPQGVTTTAPTAITGADTPNKNGAGAGNQDTRILQINNGTLYVSMDSKEGTGNNRSYIGTLGNPPATTQYGTVSGGIYPSATQLTGFGTSTGKVTLTTGTHTNGNSLNNSTTGNINKINLSPMGYFFASPTVLYVADTGNPKNDSNGDTDQGGSTNIGNGGLQKWVNNSGTWSLLYTLYNGLNLVNNGSGTGTSGLYGLAGLVSSGTAYLYVTTATLNDLDKTYLYGISDVVSNTTVPSTSSLPMFTLLETAPAGSNFKGVSLAPSIAAGSVEITSSPSGYSSTVSGTGCAPGTYTTPWTLAWTPGSSCTLSVTSPQNGGTGVQYAFSQWEDGTTSTSHTVTAPATTAIYNATFATTYQIVTAAGTGGSVSGGGYEVSGSNFAISATPSNGYYFVNFTDSLGNTYTANPMSLPVTAPDTVTANFAAQTTPTITWASPAAIIFGSALGSGQLNATANVPGTFAYTPAVGTVLSAGAGQTLSTVFTPTSAQYATISASTTIDVNAASVSTPANLLVTKVLSRSGGNVIVTVTVSNSGGTDATNVLLSSVKIGTLTATPLPVSLDTIRKSSTAQATFSVPGSVGAAGTSGTLTVTGSYTGGTLSSTARITLP